MAALHGALLHRIEYLQAGDDLAAGEDAGTPENQPALAIRFMFGASGEHPTITVPVTYRWVDPVAGERYRSLEVGPFATLSLDRGAYLFPTRAARPVEVTVRSGPATAVGQIKLELPEGWKSAPAAIAVRCAPGGADTTVRFQVTPAPAGSSSPSRLAAYLETETGQRANRERIVLDYPHLAMQTLFPLAEAPLVLADLAIRGRSDGYVMGSGPATTSVAFAAP